MGKPIQSAQVTPQTAAAGGNALGNTFGNTFGNAANRPGYGVPPPRAMGPQQVPRQSTAPAVPQAGPQLSRTPGPQVMATQASNISNTPSASLPVNQNALNYLNNWYGGTPAPWGAPAQPAAQANPYQNNVVPPNVAPRYDSRNAGTPAPTTSSLMQPPSPTPAATPLQQNPNWGALFGNGPGQFAQGFNPLSGNSMIEGGSLNQTFNTY